MTSIKTTKPRHLYDATDTVIDQLSDGSATLLILTRQDIDLNVLLTAAQVRKLLSQIASLPNPEAPPSEPRSKA